MFCRTVRALAPTGAIRTLALAQFTKDLLPALKNVAPRERAVSIMRGFSALKADEIAALERAAKAAGTVPRTLKKKKPKKNKTLSTQKMLVLSGESQNARAAARQAAREAELAARASRLLEKEAQKRKPEELRLAKAQERELKAKAKAKAEALARTLKRKARAQRLLEQAMAITSEINGQLVLRNRKNTLIDAEAKLKKAVAVCSSPLPADMITAVLSALTRTSPQKMLLSRTAASKTQPKQPGTAYRRFVRSCKGRADLAGKSGPERMRLIAKEFQERKAAGTLPKDVVAA